MIFISGTKDFHFENTAVAIGKFDGLHKGHQTLIEKINNYDGLSVLLTFDFHPVSILKGENPKLIYTSEERRIQAERMGIDVLIEYPFNEETAHMPAEDFIREVLCEKLGAKHVAVGEDFRFGAGRMGNADMLSRLGQQYGYEAHICKKVFMDIVEGPDSKHLEIAATLIREAISNGDMELANALLGCPYTIFGTVAYGRQIGRTIDMPTANVEPEDLKLLPPNGVYASKTYVNGKEYMSVTNIGKNPTVAKQQKRRSETFIYDFNENIYGQKIEVQLLHHLRPERKFESVDALKAQMHQDMEQSLIWQKAHI